MSIETETVPTKTEWRAKYRRWAAGRGEYYQPTPDTEAAMFEQVEEGDALAFDFAHSFRLVRNGITYRVNRNGEITEI